MKLRIGSPALIWYVYSTILFHLCLHILFISLLFCKQTKATPKDVVSAGSQSNKSLLKSAFGAKRVCCWSFILHAAYNCSIAELTEFTLFALYIGRGTKLQSDWKEWNNPWKQYIWGAIKELAYEAASGFRSAAKGCSGTYLLHIFINCVFLYCSSFTNFKLLL